MREEIRPTRNQRLAMPWDELAGIFDDYDGDEHHRQSLADRYLPHRRGRIARPAPPRPAVRG